MPKLPHNLGKVSIISASAIASLACPVLLPATGAAVIHALAPNIASDMIMGLRYDRIKEYFRPTHPNQLNHDLARLLHTSSIEALKNLEILYTEKVLAEYDGKLVGVGKEWVKQAKKEFKALRSELELTKIDQLNSEAFLASLDGANAAIISVLPAIKNAEIEAFVHQQIEPQLILAFKEALKDPINSGAWKAMQLWLLEETMAQNRSLLEGQLALKTQLAGLKLNPANRNIAFDQALENALGKIQDGIGQLLGGQEMLLKNQARILEAVIRPKKDIPQRVFKSKGNILGSDYPIPKEIYLDRVQFKNELQQLLQKHQWVNVYGTSGTGKTTFASDFFNDSKLGYEYVAWVNFSTDLPGAYVQTFYENDLDLSQKNWNVIRNVARKEAAKLRNLNGSILIVIDGIRNWAELTEDFDLIGIDQAHFLFISETPTIQDFIHKVAMPKLKESQVLDLFNRFIGIELNSKDVDDLDGNLYLTDLILKNAPRSNAKELRRFIKALVSNPASDNSVFEIARAVFRLNHLPHEAVWVLLQIAAINTPFLEADSLAEFLSELPDAADPEMKIADLKGFQKFLEEQTEPEFDSEATIIDQLEVLEKSGWLNLKLAPSDVEIRSYAIHPISSQILQAQYEPSILWYPELAENLKSGFFADLLSPLKDNESYKSHLEHFLNYIEEEPLENYLSILWKQIQLYEDLVLWNQKLFVEIKYHNLILEIEGDIVERSAIAKMRIGDTLNDLGQYNEARKWLEKALEIGKIVFGEESSSLWTYYISLGRVVRQQGDYPSAKSLLDRALFLLYNQDKLNENNIAVGQSDLGQVYRELGEYERARELFEKSLALGIRNLGEHHPNVAIWQSNLGQVYGKLGEYEKARELIEKSLASDLQNFGELHPKVATNRNSLALLYKSTEAWSKAVLEFEKALFIIENSFGKDHPYFINVSFSLQKTIKKGADAGDPEMIALNKKMELE